MKHLDKTAVAIAKSIMHCDSVRVISHNDADGITSAGLICNALLRAKIPFQATLLNRLDESTIRSLEGPVIFCDMGSGKPELISRVRSECFVLDHHRPTGTLDCMHLNPHLFGIDGAFELSAAGTVYSVVRHMGDNVDLAGLALVGAIGDRQAMIGANRSILDEAVASGAVELRAGLNIAEDGPVDEAFQRSIEPLLDFTGDSDKTKEFLEGLKIKGDVQNLEKNDLARLCTAITLKLLMQGSSAADSVIGEVIRLKHEVVENSLEMVQLLNACGNRDVPGLGLTLCMRDKSALGEARRLASDYKGHILKEINALREQNETMKNIRYLKGNNMEAGSVVAGLGIRYLYTDLPLITLNHKDDTVKISARGTKPLISRGLDLSAAIRKAAEAVGGVGGGHTIASGGSIPPGTEEIFLKMVDEIVGSQLHKGSAPDEDET
ncbi:MAG: DHHA1 domain protein [Methanosaeta sp. PtaB.Bin018]|jgi:single-stranded DNA-specific DHH superfamily exonuclease|nr:DHH family phosphoesterase [Methanothrix sp.]OPX75483.1 MAG: DHHA1 domain protein [Methanosaeta sp. PtaB.Bin018]OPY47942.1 MAG: DHHA1 domain protein [Methanosaeta sp. PtaU1.Bin016]